MIELLLAFSVIVLLAIPLLWVFSRLPERQDEQPASDQVLDQSDQNKTIQTSRQKKILSFIRRGRLALKKGNFKAAEDYLYQVSGIDEQDDESLAALAQALYSQNKLEKARVVMERLVQQEPTSENLTFLGQLLFEIGQVNEDREDMENSIMCYQVVLKQNPQDLEAKKKLAQTYLALGMQYETRLVYEQIFKEDPTDLEVGLFLANYYQEKDQLDKAEAYLASLFKIYSTDEDVASKYFSLLAERSKYDKIVKYRAFLDSEPSNKSFFLELLGRAYLHLRRFQEAIDYLELYCQIEPDPDGYFNLALAYYQTGCEQQALEYIQAAIDLNSNSARCHYLMAQVYIQQEEYQKAQTALWRVLDLDEQNREARLDLERIKYKLSTSST